jgi:uncharacterized protein (TIGR02284 family)
MRALRPKARASIGNTQYGATTPLWVSHFHPRTRPHWDFSTINFAHSTGETMATTAIDALHDIHTATNDVLKGYREMSARAKPEIQLVIRQLSEMHEQHATEQAAALASLRDPGKDDSSLQGTVNKVVVILRDWLTDLDREVMPAVREGEESLCKEYDKALQNALVSGNSSVAELLKTQRRSIVSEIARLPQS